MLVVGTHCAFNNIRGTFEEVKMKKVFEFHPKSSREKHNQDIIERMKSGDTLQRYTAQSSWFPPRPVIKKDSQAIEILYGATPKEQNGDETKTPEKN
jgi:hypothetical protein